MRMERPMPQIDPDTEADRWINSFGSSPESSDSIPGRSPSGS